VAELHAGQRLDFDVFECRALMLRKIAYLCLRKLDVS
jgi:hypothetical protein